MKKDFNKDLISIIVPIYNVEIYIEDLVKSICSQTYENIEILLIDDGSKDDSGKIIDKLSILDKRIKVYHKENGGVSSARNLGIQESNGSILLFIDGDDKIVPDYVEYFYDLLVTNNCDVAVNFDRFSVFDEKYDIVDNTVMSNEIILEKMYYGELNEAVWNKAYKKKFLLDHNIVFDSNIWFGEGMLFNCKCFQYASKIAVGNKKVYYQTWNPNSAMRKFNLESNLCGIKSLHLQKELWIVKTPDIEKAWEYHLRCFNRSILCGILKSNEKKEYLKEYKECKKNLRKNLNVVLLSKVSLKRKIYYLCMAIAPDLVAKRDIIKERKYNKVS